MDGVWRTIAGRRIFIQKGQSLSDAMKNSGKFKTEKKDMEIQRRASPEVRRKEIPE